MKLLLRPDAYRASTVDGLRFLTPHGPVSFDGTAIAPWVDRLEPYLDGRFSAAELTAGLDERSRPMAERVLAALIETGVIREIPADQNHPDSMAEAARPSYDSRVEQRYLGYFRAGPEEIWSRYHHSRAVVIGSGVLAAALARACGDSGIKRVDDREPDAVTEEFVTSADIILHVIDARTDDGESLASERELARWLRSVANHSGAILGQVVDFGDRAVFGPIGGRTAEWDSASRRLLAMKSGMWRQAGTAESAERTADGATYSAYSTHSVVANQVAQLAFRAYTGIADDSERDALTSVRYRDLHTNRHAFLPHPYANPTADRSTRSMEPVDRELAERELSERTAPLRDQYVGVFGDIAEHGYAQFPMHISEVVISDPVGLAGGPVRVAAAGPDFASARYLAALRGYAVYGSLLIDPRLVDIPAAGDADSDPDIRLAALRSGRLTGTVRGERLIDGDSFSIDVRRAFPVLTGVPAGASIPGRAAGYSWRHALETALLSHFQALLDDALAGTEVAFPAIALPAGRPEELSWLDSLGRRYLALVRATARSVIVLDLSAVFDVPCALVRTDGVVSGCAMGISMASAVRAALADALLTYQSSRHHEPAYAPPRPPEPPNRCLMSVTREPADTELTVPLLVERLVSRGYQPVAVPLDHDPEVIRRMPFIVQVVLNQ